MSTDNQTDWTTYALVGGGLAIAALGAGTYLAYRAAPDVLAEAAPELLPHWEAFRQAKGYGAKKARVEDALRHLALGYPVSNEHLKSEARAEILAERPRRSMPAPKPGTFADLPSAPRVDDPMTAEASFHIPGLRGIFVKTGYDKYLDEDDNQHDADPDMDVGAAPRPWHSKAAAERARNERFRARRLGID